MPIDKVTILGCGLIGGSLGAALRTCGFAGSIVGYDAEAVLEKGLRLGAIDVAATSVESAVWQADVVVLATPISSIISLLPTVARHAPPESLVTDTGSTKAEIVAQAGNVFGDSAALRFLPGHPISGKERAGVEQADPYLFRGAKWVFTPIDAKADFPGSAQCACTPRQAEWVELMRRIGATPTRMTPERHDLVLAFTSHLPQLLSVVLANTVLSELRPEAEEGGYSHVPYGGGLRDMTRLAKSDPLVWRDILATNTANIERALEELQRELNGLSLKLKERELDGVQRAFQSASAIGKLS